MWHPDGPLPTVLYLPGHDDSVTEQDQFDTTNGIRKAPQGSPTAQKIRFLSGCCYNIFEPRGIYSHFARRHGQHFFPLTGWMLRIILWFTCVQVTFVIWRMTYMSTYFAANAGYGCKQLIQTYVFTTTMVAPVVQLVTSKPSDVGT